MVQLRSFPFTSILGWSVSRYDKFSACKRQYYYDYYGKYDTEYPRQKLMSLKQLTSMPLEIGNIVHDVAKALLERFQKSTAPIQREKLNAFARHMADEYCQKKQFSEVYYNVSDAVDMSRIYDGVQLCLNNVLGSERFAWLQREALSNTDEWIIEPPGYGETRIQGMKAYCKVDFLFPVGENIYIVDWKTGKCDEYKHRRQLLGYVTWAAFHFDVSPEKIVPIVSYLQPSYSELESRFVDNDVHNFAVTVKNETDEMYAYCTDVERNMPKEKSAFLMTDNTRICGFCNYRELCGR